MNDTDDWYQSHKLATGIYTLHIKHENTHSNMFLIEGEEKLLIDTGRGIGDLKAFLQSNFGLPDKIILTHTHWDHIGNAYQFSNVAAHPREHNPQGGVSIDGLSAEFINRPSQFLQTHCSMNLPLPDTFDEETFQIPSVQDAAGVVGGDTVDLGNRKVDVIDIPGHSPGQIALLDRQTGTLFGADILHVHKGGFVHFNDSNIHEHLESLSLLSELRDIGSFSRLATAHNPPLSGDDLTMIDEHIDSFRNIISGNSTYDLVDTPWGKARQYQTGSFKILTKPELL